MMDMLRHHWESVGKKNRCHLQMGEEVKLAIISVVALVVFSAVVAAVVAALRMVILRRKPKPQPAEKPLMGGTPSSVIILPSSS
jgi:hypothetical protein